MYKTCISLKVYSWTQDVSFFTEKSDLSVCVVLYRTLIGVQISVQNFFTS